MATVISGRLKELVEQVTGAQAALLVDADGLTVDSFRHPDSDVEPESLSAELNTVLARARDATARLQFGIASEIALSTDNYHLLCCVVRGGYYLILTLSRDGVVGQGRFFLQRMAFALRSEI